MITLKCTSRWARSTCLLARRGAQGMLRAHRRLPGSFDDLPYFFILHPQSDLLFDAETQAFRQLPSTTIGIQLAIPYSR